jgi:PEP-CTERM putative exosortase interaction domain
MKRFALALMVILGTLPVVVRADTLRTFSLDGSNSEGHIGGVVTIDTTTGDALFGSINFVYAASGTPFADPGQSLDMNLAGQFTNSGCNDCVNSPNTRRFGMSSSNSDGSYMAVVLSTPTTLVDYMGGPLCFRPGCDPEASTTFLFFNVPYPPLTFNGVQYPGGTIGAGESFFNATLTQVSEVDTPEPSTWVLIGTGLLGLGSAVKRRVVASS